ncbi:MAG: Panacea domain-containing protein [Actinobacteria bacterium]|nr:Panacea domain-containing protein [Actinomycetota bacterium]
MSYDVNKLVDILSLLAKSNQELTKLRINKLLYFIDKFHLRKYGRLVLDDKYIALQLGPVAEISNNILDDFISFEGNYKGYLKECFNVGKNKKGYPELKIKKECDLGLLSKSEKEIIVEVISKYGEFSTLKLVDISHQERAWKETIQPEEIDYKLLLDGIPDDKRELIEELIELDRENELLVAELNK